MPELPDVELYVERLQSKIRGTPVSRVRIASPFVLRTTDPPVGAVEGKVVREVRRLGKRIVLALENDLFLVIHLMVLGRLRWREPGAAIPGKRGLLAIDFPSGTLLLTEEGTKRRASLHVVAGETALSTLDRGGLEPLGSSPVEFAARLRAAPHTLKRAMTDPRVLSGVGNAYSDEILHRARLSPFRLTRQLDDDEMSRLHDATQHVLRDWIERLRKETPEGSFPEKVTAFREGMSVHGRYRQPCPVCGSPVQRIAYAENEANYCARCQTAGRLLADRALSRLLKDDWPKTLDELESTKGLGALAPRRSPEGGSRKTPAAGQRKRQSP
ncbi:MAG: formamidopyrimidine-DNA glycosylase [Deltaproteobacteria bacterium]|nr:formamidopyrimidine-DNA glycosylase [Deltaproteobacteria bacterium]